MHVTASWEAGQAGMLRAERADWEDQVEVREEKVILRSVSVLLM